MTALPQDAICALWIGRAAPAGKLVVLPWLAGHRVGDSLISEHTWSHQTVDTGKPRFWSPELPEIAEVSAFAFEHSPLVHAEARLASGPVARSVCSKHLTSFSRRGGRQ